MKRRAALVAAWRCSLALPGSLAVDRALAGSPSPGQDAKRDTPAYDLNFETVQALLEQPESRMDLASIKLTIDRMVDPAIDKAAVLKRLDVMTAEIKASFPFGANNLAKFKTLVPLHPDVTAPGGFNHAAVAAE